MSTMIISIQSLANVRASLEKSFVWREDSDITPLCVFDAFIPNGSRFQAKRKNMSQSALDFVTLALVFNLEEYSGGKYAKINAEPVDVLTDLVMALKCKTKFYDPQKEPNNIAVKILNEVYNSSLDVVNNTLCGGDIPSDIADKVCDVIYE